MNIKSATFVKGIIGTDPIFENGTPGVVFIGRSNVGKSSVINTLANQKSLVRVSSTPGRTQEINIFLINKSFYLIDVPGYGFAKVPQEVWHRIQKMIDWFLFTSNYKFKKVVLIIDANIGPTHEDMAMYDCLEEARHDIVIVANKIDKIKKSEYDVKINKIKEIFKKYKVIPYSAEKKLGVGELIGEIAN